MPPNVLIPKSQKLTKAYPVITLSIGLGFFCVVVVRISQKEVACSRKPQHTLAVYNSEAFPAFVWSGLWSTQRSLHKRKL